MTNLGVLKAVSVIDANRLDRVTLSASLAVSDTIYLAITDNASGLSKSVVLDTEGILTIHDWLAAWIRDNTFRGTGE